MANVRFLDNVAVTSFESGGNDTASGAVLPRVILAGQTFRVSPNTSVSTYRLTVAGTLIMEVGPQVELPDGQIVRADSQLYVGDFLENQGTIINGGLIEIGGNQD